MMIASILYSCVNGTAGNILEAALAGAEKALTITLQLCAGYMLFCGLMEIARGVHMEKGLQRIMRPMLRKLMPNVHSEEARGTIALNLSMNVLGLGNAATPMGLEAMRRMEAERELRPNIRHDMYMLLILNATSIQLLPTTVLTLRTAAGSANVNAVLLPTILCTGFSTFAGVVLGLICRKVEEQRSA